MKRSLNTIAASLLAMAVTAGPVLAGSYTVTLTPEQDSELAWAVKQQPVPEAPASPVTPESLLQEIVDNAVKQWAARQEATAGEEMGKKLGKMSKEDRQKVCAVVAIEGCE